MVDTTLYKVGVIKHLEGCGNCKSKNGKALKACKVQILPGIDDDENFITVVTSASNVRIGSRIVVAPVGTTYMTPDGEEHPITKASVGGVTSEGMFCDSTMLGWSGGGMGVAAQVTEDFEIGSPPPSEKPQKRPKEEAKPYIDGEIPPEAKVEVKGLFEKKLTKEEKKKLAEERRKKRKEAKAKKEADAKKE